LSFGDRCGLAVLLLLSATVACRPAGRDGSVGATREWPATAERRRNGVAVFNLGSEPTSLDPARGTRLVDLRSIGQCLEGLVRVRSDGRLEPAAAESWEISPDGRTYRFRLRPARWSNGEPVRSTDFAFAWRRVLDPATRAYWADLFFAIEGAPAYYRASPDTRAAVPLGIETPDDQTLVVRLARPTPYFLSLLALEAFYPLHQATVERLGDAAFDGTNFVCNGPFRLVEHQPRQRIVFERNPTYRPPVGRTTQASLLTSVPLHRLVFVMVENEFTEWTAYRRGEIDITESVDRSVLSALRGTEAFRTAPLIGTSYLCYNCRRPPFDRAEVRRAFALALDRRLLADRIMRGGELPATGFVPPGIPSGPQRPDFRAEGGDLLPSDLPTSSAVQRSAFRVPRSAFGGLLCGYTAIESQRSLAVALQMMWRERLGIEVGIQSYPARLLTQNKRSGDYLIATASWVGDYLDPTTFLDTCRSDSPNNHSRWSNPRYDLLLDRAAATTDVAARADLLHQAERLLIEEMPICPLYFYAVAYLQRPGLEGVERNPLGRINFSEAHWTEMKSRP
jgi:oligopeptide transport system substrate-binding protein